METEVVKGVRIAIFLKVEAFFIILFHWDTGRLTQQGQKVMSTVMTQVISGSNSSARASIRTASRGRLKKNMTPQSPSIWVKVVLSSKQTHAQ